MISTFPWLKAQCNLYSRLEWLRLLPCLYSFTLFTAALGDKPKQSITHWGVLREEGSVPREWMLFASDTLMSMNCDILKTPRPNWTQFKRCESSGGGRVWWCVRCSANRQSKVHVKFIDMDLFSRKEHKLRLACLLLHEHACPGLIGLCDQTMNFHLWAGRVNNFN